MEISNSLESELQALQIVRNDLSSSKNGYSWHSSFLEASSNVMFDTRLIRKMPKLTLIRDPLSNINQDIWNLCSIASRISWFHNIAIQNNWHDRNPFKWSLYTSLDIQEFHVEVRSILDYISIILVNLSDNPGQVRNKDSFRALCEWFEAKPENENKLGDQVSDIIRSVHWHKGIRQIRDNLIHYGANAFVFGKPTDGILFQVTKNFKNLINVRELMWNEHVVDFELYAGLYFARLLLLLTKIGNLILSRIPEKYDLNTTANYDGLYIYACWIDKLIEKIKAVESTTKTI